MLCVGNPGQSSHVAVFPPILLPFPQIYSAFEQMQRMCVSVALYILCACLSSISYIRCRMSVLSNNWTTCPANFITPSQTPFSRIFNAYSRVCLILFLFYYSETPNVGPPILDQRSLASDQKNFAKSHMVHKMACDL